MSDGMHDQVWAEPFEELTKPLKFTCFISSSSESEVEKSPHVLLDSKRGRVDVWLPVELSFNANFKCNEFALGILDAMDKASRREFGTVRSLNEEISIPGNPTDAASSEEKIARLADSQQQMKAELKVIKVKVDNSTKPSKNEQLRNQRNEFSHPRLIKEPPETWPEIYEAYSKKYPEDKMAKPATLRLSYTRDPKKRPSATDS